MSTTASLELARLVRDGFSGSITGQVVAKNFTLIAASGRVSIRFDKRMWKHTMVKIYREIIAAVADDGAVVTCSVDIVLNKNISTDNPNWGVRTFSSVDELRDADLPGGEDMLAFDRATFNISANSEGR